MGQKGSKEASGKNGDGTLVEALFIEQASVGVNDDSDDNNAPSGGRGGRARNNTLSTQDQKSELENGNPSPKRQNLFQEELEVEANGKGENSKKEKKRKSKKSSIKRRTPSRRRSARVAPSLPPKEDKGSSSDDAAGPPPATENFFEVKKEVCVEIDDETNEPSMESETESLNLKPEGDSESDSPAVKTISIGAQGGAGGGSGTSRASRTTTVTRGGTIVTVGAVQDLTPDRAARVGEPPEDTLDEVYFTPMQLYNAMNDGQLSPYLFDPSYLLLIDTRDRAFYHDNHIVTALHVSDLEEPGKVGTLEDYTILILYDATGFTYSLTDSVLSTVMEDLTGRKLEPVILKGGFDAFLEHYPFLCCDKLVPTGAQRQKMLLQYPSEVLQGQLYLGRGDQATNSAIVTNLGLTHIVNITTEHANAFPETIEYLTIRKEDEPSSDLHGVIMDIIKFTGDALLAGGKVLIHCNLGRSRSATAVIAYLMATRRWPLRDAYFYVKERRPIIDPNRGFLKQLAKFEKEIMGDNISDPDDLWMG